MVRLQNMPSDPKAVYIECNQCGSREEMQYGEWANNEVPEGWLRGSDDKTHYCPECRDGKYESTIGIQPREVISTPWGKVDAEEFRAFQEEWFKQDSSLKPNQIRAYGNVVDVNAQGGKQSHLDMAAHRLDPRAMLSLVGVLGFGDKKYNDEMCPIGDENWRKLHHYDHINHALVHMFKYMLELQYGPAPDDNEAGEHLDHALCRLMFVVGSKPETSTSTSSSFPKLPLHTKVAQAVNAVTGVVFEIDLNEIVLIEAISDKRCNLHFKDSAVTVEGSREYWLKMRTRGNV